MARAAVVIVLILVCPLSAILPFYCQLSMVLPPSTLMVLPPSEDIQLEASVTIAVVSLKNIFL